MNPKREKIKPAVEKNVLLLLAGFMWIGVGLILLTFSYYWLNTSQNNITLIYIMTGVALAMMVHHFGFLRIVDKNLGRLLPMEGKKCLFSFMTWKSYITVGFMVMLGVLLRHSTIPKPYLSSFFEPTEKKYLDSKIKRTKLSYACCNRCHYDINLEVFFIMIAACDSIRYEELNF
jgi:hypothetical protein